MTALTTTNVAQQGMPLPLGSTDPNQYLTFVLGGEVFALGILAVKEIIEYHSLTVVPMMPDCVRGVINLRGAVVPVMDLLARFGRPSSEVSKRTCIVIVEVRMAEQDSQVIGVIVDAVNEVLDIAAADIEPAPAFGARIRTDFIQGMGKVKGKFVILLNADHVLSLDEIAQLAQPSMLPGSPALN
ncbi:MAG: purine-binding chemotaxis protein CheW [Rubrivivax sp.]|nr:MAG: purine-binding chemotaxis protein CheW [Rubrivivax sp.]